MDSKKKSELLSVKIGEEVENSTISLGDREIDKINKLKEHLKKRRESLYAKKSKRKNKQE